MRERRKLTRWQISKRVPIKLEQANPQGVIRSLLTKTTKELFCQIKDINCTGAQITLNTKLPQDVTFRVSLKLAEDCTVMANVWIAWHKKIDGSNHYGFYFSQISDADRDKINKFINNFYPNDDPRDILRLGIVDAEGGRGGEEMNDHRIFERFKKEFSARFIGLDGKEVVAQTFDVSAKGLGLTTDQELESQANLEIWLDVPNSTDPLYTRGQVVWSRLAGKGNFHSGIELERADLMGISRLLRA
ncbi:MAG: PilZ domain-containing protein [Candidatus Omnitrophica bacterium]|nr:PilZ domain-containing protein [Candidatus Omnitrophota bacterium]